MSSAGNETRRNMLLFSRFFGWTLQEAECPFWLVAFLFTTTTQSLNTKDSPIWPWVKIQIVPPVNIQIPTKIGSLKWVVSSPTISNGTPETHPHGDRHGPCSRRRPRGSFRAVASTSEARRARARRGRWGAGTVGRKSRRRAEKESNGAGVKRQRE